MPAYEDHDHEKDVIYFAATNYRNQMRKFGIRTDDRRRHMYVIGKTGMGKTTLLENMILADIYKGHGCAYVDPHGDTAEKIIDFIPEWRQKDVVYFNPSDFEYPMGFNILESYDPNTRHVIAAGLMGVFKKIWPDVWSARMEYILNNSILTLLENPGNTLLGINRLLVDRDFRVKMVGKVKDPVVKSFWITEFEQWEPKFRTEAIAPIQNKVGQFLATSLVRNVVAQVTSTIVPRKFMDESKIFIVNLSKGRIGEDAMKLLGGMLITKMQLSAMERVDIPEKERRDFYLYIDEFQNFATESFASILSEARKYRLALIMAHQYIEQLTEEVRDAVFGNVGSLLTFRVGSPDALFLENEFMPTFTHEDLVNLAKYEIYLRLMINGVASEAFSALTLPPIAQTTHSTDSVIASSRDQFARRRSDVEAAILQWSEMNPEETGAEEVEKLFDEADAKRKAAKKFGNRPVFEYDCSRCGKHMVLPVELDKSRPIYCETCIEAVREDRRQGKKPEGAVGSASSPSPVPTPQTVVSPETPPLVPPPPPPPTAPAPAVKPLSAPKAPSLQAGTFVVKKTEGEISLASLQEKTKTLPEPLPPQPIPLELPKTGMDFLSSQKAKIPPVSPLPAAAADPLSSSQKRKRRHKHSSSISSASPPPPSPPLGWKNDPAPRRPGPANPVSGPRVSPPTPASSAPVKPPPSRPDPGEIFPW